MAPPLPRTCYTYTQKDPHTHFVHKYYLYTAAQMYSKTLSSSCIHSSYYFTITCHSEPCSESPLQQCSSVNSPYYITIHLRAQTQTAAEQCRSIHAQLHTLLHSEHEFWYPFKKRHSVFVYVCEYVCLYVRVCLCLCLCLCVYAGLDMCAFKAGNFNFKKTLLSIFALFNHFYSYWRKRSCVGLAGKH